MNERNVTKNSFIKLEYILQSQPSDLFWFFFYRYWHGGRFNNWKKRLNLNWITFQVLSLNIKKCSRSNTTRARVVFVRLFNAGFAGVDDISFEFWDPVQFNSGGRRRRLVFVFLLLRRKCETSTEYITTPELQKKKKTIKRL